MTSIIAAFKIALILILTALMIVPQAIVLALHKGGHSYAIPRLWHKGVCFILGLKTEVRGAPVQNQQVIYVSNHLSYLDIPAIGAHLKASFIAKDDIASWPVIGFLARVQQTAFISRSSSKAKKVANALDLMVKDGKSLILFPEGTSSPGTEVLPFKSSLFSLAQPKDSPTAIPIQPFVLELVDVNGHVITPESRDYYAWYADMEFAPHIWIFLKNKGAKIRLTFFDVVTPSPDQSRKELCKMIENQISTGLQSV